MPDIVTNSHTKNILTIFKITEAATLNVRKFLSRNVNIGEYLRANLDFLTRRLRKFSFSTNFSLK